MPECVDFHLEETVIYHQILITLNDHWLISEENKNFFFSENSLNSKFYINTGLPWWLSGKEPAGQWGDTGSVPGSGRSHGTGNHNPLQYSPLGNPMDREAWMATVHVVAKSHIQISNWACTHITVTCSWWFSTLATKFRITESPGSRIFSTLVMQMKHYYFAKDYQATFET